MRKRRCKTRNWRHSAALGLKKGKKMPTRSRLVKELDRLTAQLIKERDKNTCQKCDKKVDGANCHWSHVIPRSAGTKLRWDPSNSKVLCYYCHLRWWHKNPLEATEWFKSKFPSRWDYLMANREAHKYSPDEIMDMIAVARKKLGV